MTIAERQLDPMPKYIDADRLRLELNAGIDANVLCSQEDIDHFLYHFPAADVEPVRHARWCVDGFCSACGALALSRRRYQRKSRFCPACGAKMDLPEPPKEGTNG